MLGLRMFIAGDYMESWMIEYYFQNKGINFEVTNKIEIGKLIPGNKLEYRMYLYVGTEENELDLIELTAGEKVK